MFFSIGPDIDIKVTLFLLVACVFFAFWFYKKTKRILVSLALFSILGNMVFLLYGDSMMYDVYSIKWLQDFSLFIWPAINTALVVIIKNKLFIVWWISFAVNSVYDSYLGWRWPFFPVGLFVLEIWPMINFILFAIIAVKLFRDPNKFLNFAKNKK